MVGEFIDGFNMKIVLHELMAVFILTRTENPQKGRGVQNNLGYLTLYLPFYAG